MRSTIPKRGIVNKDVNEGTTSDTYHIQGAVHNPGGIICQALRSFNHALEAGVSEDSSSCVQSHVSDFREATKQRINK